MESRPTKNKTTEKLSDGQEAHNNHRRNCAAYWILGSPPDHLISVGRSFFSSSQKSNIISTPFCNASIRVVRPHRGNRHDIRIIYQKKQSAKRMFFGGLFPLLLFFVIPTPGPQMFLRTHLSPVSSSGLTQVLIIVHLAFFVILGPGPLSPYCHSRAGGNRAKKFQDFIIFAIYSFTDSAKSTQFGFIVSIRRYFHVRFHFFNTFSRAIASLM